MASGKGAVTLENVHCLSTFELRQELTRRGALAKDPDLEAHFGYKQGLAALVALLSAEKEAAYQGRRAEDGMAVAAPGESLKEKLQRQKEERKLAALERSRARQQDPAYFTGRHEANERRKGLVDVVQLEEAGDSRAREARESDEAEPEPLFAQKRRAPRVHVR